MNFNRRITGRTVLVSMLAFFGVIIAVNGAFVYFALSSWPGLSTNQPYEKGIKYNRTLEKAEQQAVTGWSSWASISKDGAVSVSVMDLQGGVVAGLEVSGVLIRPAQIGVDQNFALTEQMLGQYGYQLSNLLPGRWRLEIRAKQNGKQVYFKIHNLMVQG